MAAEYTDDNLITRMRKTIAVHPPANASVGNTTTVAAPIKPLVAIYHCDTCGGDATIIIGAKHHVFVDTSFGPAPGRMLSLASQLCPSGPGHIVISHFDKDHFYGLGDFWSTYRNAVVVTPADPAELRLAGHLVSCAHRPANLRVDNDLVKAVQLMFDLNGPVRKKKRGAADDDGERTSKTTRRRACVERTCMDPYAHGMEPKLLHRRPAAPIDLGLGVTMAALDTGVGAVSLSALRDNNDSSLAWKLSAGGIHYYTAGDLEHNEAHLSEYGFHIIKCGHHGSHEATTNTFLTRSNAKVAIIQGAHPGYNHPHADALERLRLKGVDTYATGIEISYGARDVSHVVAAGNGVDHAGDVVVIIWENAYYSVCYMQGKVLAVKTYKDRTLLDDTAGAPFADAIRLTLPLPAYTDFTARMNKGLKDKRDNLPTPKPSFDAYRRENADAPRATRGKRPQCSFDPACTEQVILDCGVCVASMCKAHWDAFRCPERRCGRPTWPDDDAAGGEAGHRDKKSRTETPTP